MMTSPLLWSQAEATATTPSVEIFEAVWRETRDGFCDPRKVGADWDRVRVRYRSRAEACRSPRELLTLLREMLGHLRNSHILLYSREEWRRRGNILPFYLDGRQRVRDVLRRDGRLLADLQAGDELLTVDGAPAKAVRPLTLARLEEVDGNPTFGAPGSIAKVEVARAGRRLTVDAPRVTRPNGYDPASLEWPRSEVAHLRFYTLEERQLPAATLEKLWAEAASRRGLILDLRNCVGGDPKIYAFLMNSLLEPGKPLFRWVPRTGSGAGLLPAQTEASGFRYKGPLAILINGNSESAPEIVAATLQEYRRGKVFGQTSAGALNGPTKSYGLPENFALFALPYARSVSPAGVEYEGRGVRPDVVVRDDSAGGDAVLARALRDF